MMTEELKERFDLVTERIRTIREMTDTGKDCPLSEAEMDYFFELSNLAVGILPVLSRSEKKEFKKATLADLCDEQRLFYGRFAPEKYDKGFLNPPAAMKKFGKKLGGILSAFYMDFCSVIPWSYAGRAEWITCYFELLDEIYTIFEEDALERGENESEDKNALYGQVKNALHSFYQDYSEVFSAARIEGLLDPSEDFFTDVLMQGDLSDPRFLYAYGYPVGKNEIGLWEYLNTLSGEEIDGMAETFVHGFLDGAAITGRDISGKKTVSFEYPIGLERLMRRSAELFSEEGLSVTLQGSGTLSMDRRGEARDLYSTSLNRQAVYDHRNDRQYYYDKSYVGRRLEVISDTFEKERHLAREYAGPAVVETFGEADFTPVNKEEIPSPTKAFEALSVEDRSRQGQIREQYIPGEEYTFTIISYPLPEIGPDFEKIFRETVHVNTLSSDHYHEMQQKIIDLLDTGYAVHVRGRNGNATDLHVSLHPLADPSKETIFENCGADVNIPVGEVFTSPRLEDTEGVLNVNHVYLNGFAFKNLTLRFHNGCVTDYSCDNFPTEGENKRLIEEHILFHHKTLPLGEFAIGTNTAAYRMGRVFGIEEKLPILIAEKTGPHFAVGDTCYSYAEDIPMKNPDGKEVVARSNSIVDKYRKTEPEKAYFNCHTDITIPYDELESIIVLRKDGSTVPIISDGKFVVPGTEELNEPLKDL